ncbi:hypothetical protein ACFU8T_00275 [Sphingobacterium spiritivorum]|uniref:Uncharacterized protein n=1 Tax=Sphingobacterium spiritivorum ATCC 33861 TaxID=525373 RepID=D7VGP3_SPHSI|nr:hypothetical protein [Sphingobacterium spiritivorum]EFK59245.1 hypothetical protein HMPREF0766_10162 [Sphingobacterium spiritivorum ATCC 33861]QQT34052.1 hypothetical protein I6J01_11905 [Sphingobacterium spiritivorum]WQD34881.1 hypothetical protein U0038_03850 [Sphingobacterium spiritivorum]SUI98605.1 Uncharacterised protein [Sphingobacterium spiritivorum]
MEIKKYIIIDSKPILFPVEFTHADIAYQGAKIESAGIFTIFEGHDKRLRVKCMGKSNSLSVKSHPERDEFLIATYLGLMMAKQNNNIMPEISAYINSETDCLQKIADSMSLIYNETIAIKNNCILLPKAIGEGYMSIVELSNGLALFRANVRFKNQVKLSRNVIPSNTHLYLHFNLSESSCMIKKENGKMVDLGTGSKEMMFYSSSGKGIEMELPYDKWAKWITIIIHRSWLTIKQLNYSTHIGGNLIQAFLQNRVLQGMINLTTEEISLAYSLMEEKEPDSYMRLETKGKVLKLISYF